MTKNRNIKFLDSIINNIGALIMLMIIIIVFYQVILRYVFKVGLPWSEEIARYLLIWLAMVGAVMAFKDKEFLKLELYVSSLSLKYQKLFCLFSSLITIFVSSVLLFYGFSLALLNRSQYSPSITWLRLFWVCIAIPVGGGLIMVYAIKDFLKELNLLKEEKF